MKTLKDDIVVANQKIDGCKFSTNLFMAYKFKIVQICSLYPDFGK